MTTGFDVSTATKFIKNMCNLTGEQSDVVDIEFNSMELNYFLLDIGGDDTIEKFDLSTAYDVSTCSLALEEHFAGDFQLVGITNLISGTKYFIYDLTGNDIRLNNIH